MKDENLKESPPLRGQAEQRLESGGGGTHDFDDRDPRALIHELQVHQIELEMQNEELRCSQQQLEEERQRYQDFYEFTPVGYLTLDEKGNILELNLTAAKMLCGNRSSIVKRPLGQFISPESRNKFKLFLQCIFSGKDIDRCDLKLADGLSTRTFLHIEGISTGDDKGRPRECRVVMSDITEIKLAEEVLHRYELLADHSRDIILFVRRDDGQILEANAAAVNAYGYDHEELQGLTLRNLRAAETLEQAAAQMADADTKGILFETLHRRKDGSTFPVEVSSQGATINGTRTLVSVIRDITERKQAEERLLLQARMLDSVGQAVIATDIQQSVIYWNKTAAIMFGWTCEEVLGRTLPDILHPQVSPTMMTEVTATLARGETWSGEFVVECRDNRMMPLFTTNSPVFDELGSFIAIIGIGADITERKKTEELILLQLDKLNTSNEELSRFNTASVGRELRMIELKKEINELCRQLGQPTRYSVDLDEEPA